MEAAIALRLQGKLVRERIEAALAFRRRLPCAPEAATMPQVATIQPTDEELLARVARGDREAFGDLYHRYARAVLGLALRRLGDRGRAEDAVQEAFASIWRSARSYRRERGPVAPWLYTVARNAIADRGRARIEPPAEPGDSPSDSPGPADQAEQSWVAWRVHRALEELPESERSVLELAYWSGLSQSEISDFLGIPLGTVKTRTRSGLRRLADELEGELE
jgi:RNA polymerase sigma-70 factor (ECF subfamily)